jgi:hypothetical protein
MTDDDEQSETSRGLLAADAEPTMPSRLRSWALAPFIAIAGLANFILCDYPVHFIARRKVYTQVADARRTFESEMERLSPMGTALGAETARKYFDSEVQRRRGIEDKARSNLLGIAVACSVMFGGVKLLVDFSGEVAGPWAIASLILLVYGVLCFLAAGACAVEALDVREVFVVGPEREISPESEWLAQYILWCMEQNERSNVVRTNAIGVSNRLIRNGVASLGALIVMIAGLLYSSGAGAVASLLTAEATLPGPASRPDCRQAEQPRLSNVDSGVPPADSVLPAP